MAVSMSGNKPTLLRGRREEEEEEEEEEETRVRSTECPPEKVRMRLSYNGTCDTLLTGVSRNDAAEQCRTASRRKSDLQHAAKRRQCKQIPARERADDI
jgi:hypothetical protein